MAAVTVLTEALAQGGKVLWEPPERPKLILPKGTRERLEPDRETIREVLRRATILREQAQRFIRDGKALPLLALPEHQGGTGCLSCGVPVKGGHFRCELCALAVTLAMEANR